MTLSTKIKQTIAALGLCGLLTTNNGCVTAAGVVASPLMFTDKLSEKACEVCETYPFLLPLPVLCVAVGAITSPLTALNGGIHGLECDLEIANYFIYKLVEGHEPPPPVFPQEKDRKPDEDVFRYYLRRIQGN